MRHEFLCCGLPGVKKAKAKAKTNSKDEAEKRARRAVIETALAMSRTGLSPGRSGNVSCRWKGGMLITPSGMEYETLKARDIVFISGRGTLQAKSLRKPSSVAGGNDIPLVPYDTFGTEELAGHVAGGLAKRNACLMANHGQIAIGKDLAAALELAHEVEVLAEQYAKVLALGQPHILPDDEMARILERFKTYGQRAQGN